MVVGLLLITPSVEICIQQLGRVEKNGLITICHSEYLACTEQMRRAGLSAAAEIFVRSPVL